MKCEKEENDELDLSIFDSSDSKEFAEKIREHKGNTKKAFYSFVANVKTEAAETQEASKILVKYLKEGAVTDDEEKELKTQVYDLLKVLGIGVPFALIPGASLLIPFLVKVAKKKGIDLLPTAFNEGQKND